VDFKGKAAPVDEDLAKGILEAIDMDSYRVEKKAALAVLLPNCFRPDGQIYKGRVVSNC
jgi:hypothetical protein